MAQRAQVHDLNRRQQLPATPPPHPSRASLFMASCCALFSTVSGADTPRCAAESLGARDIARCCAARVTALWFQSLGRSLMGEPPRMAASRGLLGPGAAPGRPGRKPRAARRSWSWSAHDPERCAAAHQHLQLALADARARAYKLERMLNQGLARGLTVMTARGATGSVASVVHGPRWSPDGSPVRLPTRYRTRVRFRAAAGLFSVVLNWFTCCRRCLGVGASPPPPRRFSAGLSGSRSRVCPSVSVGAPPGAAPAAAPGLPQPLVSRGSSPAIYALQRREAAGAPTPPEFETVL